MSNPNEVKVKKYSIDWNGEDERYEINERDADSTLGDWVKYSDYQSLESQLSTANAKIVELENDLSVIKELEKTLGQPYHLWAGTVLSQARTIATTNKKAEKLVEAVQSVVHARAIAKKDGFIIHPIQMVDASMKCEQAINEFRGEK